MKYFLIGLGWIFVGLGALGAVLPVLPTTPFILLAVFFFSKGSDRFHTWLIQSNLYKKYGKRVVEERTLDVKSKFKIVLTAYAMLAISFILTDSMIVKTVIISSVIAIFLTFTIFIKNPSE